MDVFALVMYIFAVVCFAVAAAGRGAPARVNLVALGLAFAVLPALVRTVAAVAGT